MSNSVSPTAPTSAPARGARRSRLVHAARVLSQEMRTECAAAGHLWEPGDVATKIFRSSDGQGDLFVVLGDRRAITLTARLVYATGDPHDIGEDWDARSE